MKNDKVGVFPCVLTLFNLSQIASGHADGRSLLASGSKDNDIVLWDVLGEVGLFRLRGHPDQDMGCVVCLFVTGDRYGVVGAKSGSLEIIDVRSGTSVEEVKAHTGSVQSIVSLPDGNGFVTGSTDHDVKFWEYETTKDPGQDSAHLTVSNVRTLPMNDDVILVAVSPTESYLAVALLNCFIQSRKAISEIIGAKVSRLSSI
ncbi:transducin family protein / WD-40 repeat family protein [Artemisia annua]|uniref:Transducin family protein / WD-40 repeat family protein n=1 Tax=Artemisia annua TaxID=35608 RepID=A0A2U1KTV0_ARTAN|nr:transducin family protein / WD-40 repeat family protein [Artemisia annua]